MTTDQKVLAAVRRQTYPTTARVIGRELGLHTVTVAAALSHLEDAGHVRPVASHGQPRGAGGVRQWVRA